MLWSSLIAVILLLIAVYLAGFKQTSFLLRTALVFLFVSVCVGAVLWQSRLERKAADLASLKVPNQTRPDGYITSDQCRSCHPSQYSSWHASFHRTMTQVPSPESVKGDFNHVTLKEGNKTYHLERREDQFLVEMVDPNWIREQTAKLEDYEAGRIGKPLPPIGEPPRIQLPISLLTGSHHMQAYWVPGKDGNAQFDFPFTYLFELQRWVPRATVFIEDPRAERGQQVWNIGCIDCHATAGQPRLKENRFYDTRVGELGIACEACHGPGAEHVKANSDPSRRLALHLKRKGDPTIINPARLSHDRSSQICGRCHSVNTALDEAARMENGIAFTPGQDLRTNVNIRTYPKDLEMRRGSFWNDGMIRVSGREFIGLAKSPCYLRGDMSCLSCHSMHQSSPTNQLAVKMESNEACYQCHRTFEKKLAEHSHHAAGSSGTLCYNCHMPYTTYGLLKGLRSHQISSPSVDMSVETGRPNACNACHLDKTLQWTATKLNDWFKVSTKELSTENKTLAASVLWTLQGDAGQRALMGWHMGWSPAKQISEDNWFAPYLANLMEDPYPAVRLIAARSLKRLPGFERFDYDYLGSPDELNLAGRKVMDAWAKQPRHQEKSSVLLDSQGRVDVQQMQELLKKRNNRVMVLME
ncbi:MAG: c-type cytochrome precursor [Verrucomicrobiales bacterium]|nr:c-type cytochrome precursor [Verrucomicrobiales bacterium]